MGAATAIAWTDHTFNPWWGCARVSPGCNNCYAETFAHRLGMDLWGKGGERRFFGDKHWNDPVRWDRQAADEGRPHLVFCASMADVFEDRDDLYEERARLWCLIGATPHLEWQLLTKRPENVRLLVPDSWLAGCWPENLWLGVTAEDQKRADDRLLHLAFLPAPVTFVSAEPLLAEVRLAEVRLRTSAAVSMDGFRPSWVIVGGESGPGHRALNLDHARALRDECAELDIPFFFKQVGGLRPISGGDMLDGKIHKAFPERAGR